MADELRVRGQEVQIRLTKSGIFMRTVTAIENLTFTMKLDILRKGYVGETTERRDDIYKGVAVEFSFDPESQEGIALLIALRERAARRTAAGSTKINLTFVVNFPNGDRPRITVPDMKFQDPSIQVTGRDAYVSQRLSAEAEDFNTIGV